MQLILFFFWNILKLKVRLNIKLNENLQTGKQKHSMHIEKIKLSNISKNLRDKNILSPLHNCASKTFLNISKIRVVNNWLAFWYLWIFIQSIPLSTPNSATCPPLYTQIQPFLTNRTVGHRIADLWKKKQKNKGKRNYKNKFYLLDTS